MGRNFQEEIAVAPGVYELVVGWPAQREAAQYEGPGIVADLLPAMFSLVPDELKLLETPLRDADVGK